MEMVHIQPRSVILLRKDYMLAKRIFDLTLSLIALPPLLLLMGVISVLIYLDNPGPVFFKQQRTGKGGKRFGIYKFRTWLPTLRN